MVERFKQTEPKVVISVNAVYYNGKIHKIQEKLDSILAELSTVNHVVVIPFYLEAGEPLTPFHQENW